MRQVIRACTRVSLRAGTLVQPMPAVGQWRYDCTDRYEAARGAVAVFSDRLLCSNPVVRLRRCNTPQSCSALSNDDALR